jgi:hypothetical protein
VSRRTGAAALKAKLSSTDPEVVKSAPSVTASATNKVVPDMPTKKKAPPVQTKQVRLSVDLEPIPYRKLMIFAQDIAMEIGRVRIQHVWIMRALVDELLESKDLQKRIIERVEEKHGPDAK